MRAVEEAAFLLERLPRDLRIITSKLRDGDLTVRWRPDGPLYEKMLRARTYRAANAQMRQLGFATTDLALHREYDAGRDGDVMTYARANLQRFAPTKLPADYGMLAGFTHVFAHPVGYAAGYYSYKWAEVLSADAWSAFEETAQDGGVLNVATGRRYRQAVLEAGGSRPAMESFKAFRGREPSIDALLRHQGMA